MSTRLVATCMVRDVTSATAALRDPPPGADFVELRLDALGEPSHADLQTLLDAPRTIPVMVTCRLAAQGGLYAGDEEARLDLLAAALESGADLVDVEDAVWEANAARFDAERCVVSAHLERFVPRLDALAGRLLRRGTRFAKLVVPARNPRALAALLTLQELDERLSVVCTGRLAEAGRVMAAARGAPLTYAALDADDKGHTDQPDVTRLHEVHHVHTAGAGTRFFAVAGTPVGHSRSPAFHNSIMRSAGRAARMVPLDVDKLDDVLELADALRLDGLAVTHPLKAHALDLAEHALPGATTTGAANTLLRAGAGWQARNTDWKAACSLLPRLIAGWRSKRADWVEHAVARSRPGSPERKTKAADASGSPRVLLLGAGGAARAVAVALVDESVQLDVWSRDPEHAERLVDDLVGLVEARVRPRPGEPPADLIINATPVGMPGVTAGLPGAPETWFSERSALVDLTYPSSEPSQLRDAAATAGRPVVQGELFFVLQAARQAGVFCDAAPGKQALARAGEACGTPWPEG